MYSITMLSLPYGSHSCKEKPGNSYRITRWFSEYELLLSGGRGASPLSACAARSHSPFAPWGSASWLCPSLCPALLQCPREIKNIFCSTLVSLDPVCAQSLELCPTLCDPMDCSLPGSSVHGRRLEWVAMSSSRGSSPPRDGTCVFYVTCFCRQVPYHSGHRGRPFRLCFLCLYLWRCPLRFWRDSHVCPSLYSAALLAVGSLSIPKQRRNSGYSGEHSLIKSGSPSPLAS